MKIAQGSFSRISTILFIGVVLLIISSFFKNIVQFVLLLTTVIFFLLTLFLLIFFRDPERVIGRGIVAVADGAIREVTKTNDPVIGECSKISTFMNVYNVHVNRMPLDGTIKDIIHRPGSHIPAFKKDSERNERTILIIDTNIGLIKVIQIAGTLARRIVPYIHKQDKVRKGEKIGIIRLGSRVDIYLPQKKVKTITVRPRDKVKAGEDTIAEIND
jgi:phosphatidylserine decarboxylase